MQFTRLGRTGLQVSRLCLGCMTYGDPQRGPHEWTMNEESSRPLYRQAFKAGFNSRGVRMTSATEFPPNPNLYTCQWCPYGPWNGGPCTAGVKRGYNA